MANIAEYKLISFQTAKGPRAGVVVAEQVYDAAALTGEGRYDTVLGILRDWRAADGLLRKKALKPGNAKKVSLKKTRVLAPVLYPGAIFCAGANYTDRMAEMARAQ